MGRVTLGFKTAGQSIRARMVTGLAVIAPLAVTVWVVLFLFRRIDGILQPLLFRVIDRHIPGVGILATLLLLYLIGLLVHALGFRTLYSWIERFLLRLPGIRDVYGSSKTIMDTLTKPGSTGFRRVVTVEYPRPGIRVLAFVTNEVVFQDGTRELAIFMPTTPNPTTGFVFFLSATEVESTNLTVEEAFKILVSAAVVMPRPYRTTAHAVEKVQTMPPATEASM